MMLRSELLWIRARSCRVCWCLIHGASWHCTNAAVGHGLCSFMHGRSGEVGWGPPLSEGTGWSTGTGRRLRCAGVRHSYHFLFLNRVSENKLHEQDVSIAGLSSTKGVLHDHASPEYTSVHLQVCAHTNQWCACAPEVQVQRLAGPDSGHHPRHHPLCAQHGDAQRLAAQQAARQVHGLEAWVAEAGGPWRARAWG